MKTEYEEDFLYVLNMVKRCYNPYPENDTELYRSDSVINLFKNFKNKYFKYENDEDFKVCVRLINDLIWKIDYEGFNNEHRSDNNEN